MGYECNREISPQEATKEQLEQRIADVIEYIEDAEFTHNINLEAIKTTLLTGFPF